MQWQLGLGNASRTSIIDVAVHRGGFQVFDRVVVGRRANLRSKMFIMGGRRDGMADLT